EVRVVRCRPDHCDALLAKLQEAGVALKVEKEAIQMRAGGPLRAVDVKTLPYPGFPTDMQAQMMALMALARGSSVITETVFESRFLHVLERQRMGADIRIEGNHSVGNGVEGLSGAPDMASDLRARAGLVLVRPSDVPTYVEYGVVDAGVVGADILMEQATDVFEPLDLGFGSCRLAVAALQPERGSAKTSPLRKPQARAGDVPSGRHATR